MWTYVKKLACSTVMATMLTSGLSTAFIVATGLTFSATDAQAITTGIACPNITDTSGSSGGGNDTPATYNIYGAFCTFINFNSTPDSSITSTGSPIGILLNSNSDASPEWLDNFEIQHHSSTSNVVITTTPALAPNSSSGGRYNYTVTQTTTFTMQYDYGGSTYNFSTTIDPTAHTMSGFTIAAGAAPAPATTSSDTTTQTTIANFMSNRANHVLSHQPDIIGFVDGSNLNGGGPLGNLWLDANAGGVNLGFSTSRSRILAAQNQADAQNLNQNTASSDDNVQLALAPEIEEVVQTGYGYGDAAESRTGTYDVWTELYGSKTNAGASDSSYWVGYVGGHYFINEQTLVGVVGQYDWSEESNSSVNSNADGQGWMIGPYLAGQLPDQKLYYEARASWGQSTNKVSPDGTYTDAFDTTRWLVNAKVSGSYALDHLILKPAISVSYYEETQKSYTDTNANVIPAQTISIGELKFGPTLTDNIKLDNGLLFQPSFGVNGVYNFAIKDNVASQGAALGNNDLRARVDAGFNLVDQDKGRSISTSVFYDGIGINDYQSYGGKVRLKISFN